MTTTDTGLQQLNRSKVIRLITVQFTGSAISQGLVALVMLVTARQIGPGAYGQLVGSLTLVTFTSIMFSLGLNIWLLKEGGTNPSNAGNLASSVFVIKSLLGLIWLITIFILAGVINSQSLPSSFIRWNAAIVLLDSLFATGLTVFKSTLRNTINVIIEVISDTVWFISTMILVIMGVNQALPFLYTRFILLLFSVLIILMLFRKIYNASPNLYLMENAIRQCLPYASSEFLTLVYMRVDVLLVSLFLGKYVVGIYSPAVSIVNALFIVPIAIHMVMVPILSNQFQYNPRQGWKTARNNMLVMGLVGFLLSACAFLAGWFIPIILGEKFSGSQEILRILSPIPFFQSVSIGLASILLATNQQKKRSIVQAISVVTNVILNLIVITKVGIKGVAVVYLISVMILALGYGIFVIHSYLKPSILRD